MAIVVECTIQGTSAMLQHRFGEVAEGDGTAATRTQLVVRGTPREEAEKVCYRMPGSQQLYFPGAAIGRLLREAGGSHKMKGSRKAVKFVVPAAVLVLDDAIPLIDHEDAPVDTFEVDSRPVTIPATKGRVMRHRPKIEQWRAVFHIRVIDSLLPVSLVQQLLVEGGERLGIGDYRPEKGGPFGTFRVIRWDEQEALKAAE
jgi:hypothetical protein